MDGGRDGGADWGKMGGWPVAVGGRLVAGVGGLLAARLSPEKLLMGDADVGLCTKADCPLMSRAGADGRRCCDIGGN